jgi:HemY protein
MRASLWLLALFGVAVAMALLLGNNQGTVTLFWPPHRVDLSLNLTVLVLIGSFFALYVALGALQALFAMPEKTRRWRALQRERAMHAALLEGMADMLAGRFVRAARAAQTALDMERVLAASSEAVPQAGQIRALGAWLAAEAAHMLQDRPTRDLHAHAALATKGAPSALREGVQLRAARWALDDREPQTALQMLAALPQGVARRTLALRIKLKAARLAGQHGAAIDTARLLAKHKAFTPAAAQSLLRALAVEQLNTAHDPMQLQRSFDELDASVRAMPEVALHAAQRVLRVGGEAGAAQAQANEWLLPVWQNYDALSDNLRVKLVSVLAQTMGNDSAWLGRLEQSQAQRPRDAQLQYLVGLACMQRQLWGKAQQHLGHAALGLTDASLRRETWRRLAELAAQRGDDDGAVKAWREAAQA